MWKRVFFVALIGTMDAVSSVVCKAAWFAKLMAVDLRHPPPPPSPCRHGVMQVLLKVRYFDVQVTVHRDRDRAS